MTSCSRLLIAVCFCLLATPVHAGWWYTITPPGGLPDLYIGPYPAPSKTWSICADWCGSAWWRHGPYCLTNPTSYTCQPWPPRHPRLGFGQRDNGTVSTCFHLTKTEEQTLGLRKLAWGYHYIAYKHGWEIEPRRGSFTLNQCKVLTAWPYRRDRCFGVGAISNNEGSRQGP